MRKSKENEERKNLKKNTRGKRIGNKREKKKWMKDYVRIKWQR